MSTLPMNNNPYFSKLLAPQDQKAAQLEARKARALELIKQSQGIPEGSMVGGGGGDSHFGARPSIYVAPDPLEHVNKLLGDTMGTLELRNVAKATDANTEATRAQNTQDWENATKDGSFDPVAASRSSDPELRKAAIAWYANEPERAEKARLAKERSAAAIGANHEKQSDLVAKSLNELDAGMDKRRLEAKNDKDRVLAAKEASKDRWAMHNDTIANRVPAQGPPDQLQYDAQGNAVWANPRTHTITPVPTGFDGKPAIQKPLPEAAQKQQTAIANFEGALQNYKGLLADFDPQSKDPVNLAKRRAIDSAYSNLLLQNKELANLGALTGPDVGLMEQITTNPVGLRGSVEGAAFGKDGFNAQVKQGEQLVERTKQNFESQHGRKLPPSAVTPAKPRYRLKAGANPDLKSSYEAY